MFAAQTGNKRSSRHSYAPTTAAAAATASQTLGQLCPAGQWIRANSDSAAWLTVAFAVVVAVVGRRLHLARSFNSCENCYKFAQLRASILVCYYTLAGGIMLKS